MTSQMRKTAGALTICAALAGASCSSGSSGTAATTPTTDETAETEAPTDTTSPTETTAPTEPTTTDASTLDDTIERGDTAWNGEDFVALADARMDELGATFGLDAAPASVASIFELPDDFPYPAGTVLGIFHEYDQDLRASGELLFAEERIVAVDSSGDAAALDAVRDTIDADTASRWRRASNQRSTTNVDLYVAPNTDGGEFDDRLVLRGNPAPETGEPYLQIHLEQDPDEIPEPSWLAGLPVLDGGELVRVQEGRGIVESFGRVAEDGYVEVALFYPVDRFDELEVLFQSGIFESAGFTYEDTPFSNFDIRIDVSNGDWEGTVAVGNVSVDGEDIGHNMIWSLTRPGRVDAPVPPVSDSVAGESTSETTP